MSGSSERGFGADEVDIAGVGSQQTSQLYESAFSTKLQRTPPSRAATSFGLRRLVGHERPGGPTIAGAALRISVAAVGQLAHRLAARRLAPPRTRAGSWARSPRREPVLRPGQLPRIPG